MLVLDDIFGDIIFGKVRYQKMKNSNNKECKQNRYKVDKIIL